MYINILELYRDKMDLLKKFTTFISLELLNLPLQIQKMINAQS